MESILPVVLSQPINIGNQFFARRRNELLPSNRGKPSQRTSEQRSCQRRRQRKVPTKCYSTSLPDCRNRYRCFGKRGRSNGKISFSSRFDFLRFYTPLGQFDSFARSRLGRVYPLAHITVTGGFGGEGPRAEILDAKKPSTNAVKYHRDPFRRFSKG